MAATSAGASECHSQFEQIEIVSDNRSCRPPPPNNDVYGVFRERLGTHYTKMFHHMEIG